MNPISIICMSCAYTASVNKVTAGLRCACGSDDLDAYTGTVEQNAHIARLRGPKATPAPPLPTFAQYMAAAVPKNVEPNWDEYVGPMPGPNVMDNHVGPVRCPTCHGSKYDIQEGNTCRACGGKGFLTPTTSVTPAPAVAPHRYPSNETTTPFMGQRKKAGRPSGDPLGSPEDHIRASTPGWSDQGVKTPREPFSWGDKSTHYPKADNSSPATKVREPYDYDKTPDRPFEMPGTTCPTCTSGPLTLQKDHREDAWATCPNCGPLANVDKNPEVDPYHLPTGFLPGQGYKAASLLGSRKTGRLLRMISASSKANSGLSEAEVVLLARTSLRKYPESK